MYEPVPWVPAGTKVDLTFGAVGGISLIQDALLIALLHPPQPDRRHLIVGMTDRQDCGSVVSSGLLRELTGRSEAVLHLVEFSGSGGESNYRLRTCSPRARPDGVRILDDAAARTGGQLHTQSFFFRSSSLLRAFKTIFDDFRQSYVLRYSPSGVDPRGWHAIKVEVPAVKDATIRARWDITALNRAEGKGQRAGSRSKVRKCRVPVRPCSLNPLFTESPGTPNPSRTCALRALCPLLSLTAAATRRTRRSVPPRRAAHASRSPAPVSGSR